MLNIIILFLLFKSYNFLCSEEYYKDKIVNFCNCKEYYDNFYNDFYKCKYTPQFNYELCNIEYNTKSYSFNRVFNLNYKFLTEYKNELMKKIDIDNFINIINDIYNNFYDNKTVFGIIPLYKDNIKTNFILTFYNVNIFLCILNNTNYNTVISSYKEVKKNDVIFKDINFYINNTSNQIDMYLLISSNNMYKYPTTINYTLEFKIEDKSIICIYDNGSQLYLDKIDRFSDDCFQEENIIDNINLALYINNITNINYTKIINGLNYNISTLDNHIKIKYKNYKNIYNKIDYINNLECVCSRENVPMQFNDKYIQTIFCTNITDYCLLLENSLKLIKKKIFYIVSWDNTELYLYYLDINNKTDIYIKNIEYFNYYIKYINNAFNTTIRRVKRGFFKETFNELKSDIYDIGKSIENIFSSLNEENKEIKFIKNIENDYIFKAYKILPEEMYDLNDKSIIIKESDYIIDTYTIEIPELKEKPFVLSDIKSILLLIVVCLIFISLLILLIIISYITR